MTVERRAFEVVPKYGPYLAWHDLWTDVVAGEKRRKWFWDRYLYHEQERCLR